MHNELLNRAGAVTPIRKCIRELAERTANGTRIRLYWLQGTRELWVEIWEPELDVTIEIAADPSARSTPSTTRTRTPLRTTTFPSPPNSTPHSHGELQISRGPTRVDTEADARTRTGRSGAIPEHSYGVRPVNRAGVIRPAVCGAGFGGGSAPAVVDVCVATHMRGLVPHDRVCEMRSGAVLWRRAWPVGAAHSVLSGRSSRRCAGALSSPSRCVVAATPSSRAPSSARRARGRPRPRRSSGACLGPRARASVRAAGGRCGPLGLARRGTCLCVCAPA